MAIDIFYLTSNIILFTIEFVIFSLCLQIYKNTEGASEAYKMWALGTGILLIASSMYILCTLFLGCDAISSTTENEIQKTIGSTIDLSGYFYIPVGIMYLSKDLGLGVVDKKEIKKSRIIFYTIIFSTSAFLIGLIPFFELRRTIGISYNIIYASVWFITLYFYKDVYSTLKTTNICWTLLLFAVCSSLISNFTNIIYFSTNIGFFGSINLLFQLTMAFFYISGFFKLAKMVEAI